MGKMVEKVGSLEKKIDQLLAERTSLIEQSRDKNAEIENCRDELAKLKTKIDRREQQIDQLETANALLGSKEYKTKTKLKINSLIKELDECIIQLAE